MAEWLIGFDPGRGKCGLAVADPQHQIVSHQVIPAEGAIATITQLRQTFPITTLVMGNQTASKQWYRLVKAHFPDLNIQLVDETFTSQLARHRYWQMYPAQGWQKLMPLGMRVPPRPIDDIVAIILLERFWQTSL